MIDWISVEDRLPDVGDECLWFDGKETISIGLQMHIDTLITTYYGHCCVVNYLHIYTHWMPLPQPPAQEQSK